MKKKRMVIYDRDEKYAGSLMEYLSGIEDLPYVILVYSEKKSLLEDAAVQAIDLLLASEAAYADIRGEIQAGQVMILNESGELNWAELRNIKKFQSAEHIVQEIMQYYVEETRCVSKKLTSCKTAKLIGFFSPVRRCAQTTMGLTMGQMLAEKRKTLYLNFESLSGFPYMMGYHGGKDLADLLYYLETTPEKFGLQLRACTERVEGLHYVPPINAMHQMLLVRPEQWQKLITAIAEEGGYDVILLDLSEGMQGLFEVLRMCTRVYTLTQEDRYARAKIEQYEYLLQICEYEDVLKKTVKKKIPVMREVPEGYMYRLGGEFSHYIKELLEEEDWYD